MRLAFWHSIALAMTLASTPAFGQLKIGVIASSTGATAVVGIPQKNSAALLPKKIGDLTVEYLVFDDASDATQSVYNMSPADHSGFDQRGRVLITVKDGSWRLLRD